MKLVMGVGVAVLVGILATAYWQDRQYLRILQDAQAHCEVLGHALIVSRTGELFCIPATRVR